MDTAIQAIEDQVVDDVSVLGIEILRTIDSLAAEVAERGIAESAKERAWVQERGRCFSVQISDMIRTFTSHALEGIGAMWPGTEAQWLSARADYEVRLSYVDHYMLGFVDGGGVTWSLTLDLDDGPWDRPSVTRCLRGRLLFVHEKIEQAAMSWARTLDTVLASEPVAPLPHESPLQSSYVGDEGIGEEFSEEPQIESDYTFSDDLDEEILVPPPSEPEAAPPDLLDFDDLEELPALTGPPPEPMTVPPEPIAQPSPPMAFVPIEVSAEDLDALDAQQTVLDIPQERVLDDFEVLEALPDDGMEPLEALPDDELEALPEGSIEEIGALETFPDELEAFPDELEALPDELEALPDEEPVPSPGMVDYSGDFDLFGENPDHSEEIPTEPDLPGSTPAIPDSLHDESTDVASSFGLLQPAPEPAGVEPLEIPDLPLEAIEAEPLHTDEIPFQAETTPEPFDFAEPEEVEAESLGPDLEARRDAVLAVAADWQIKVNNLPEELEEEWLSLLEAHVGGLVEKRQAAAERRERFESLMALAESLKVRVRKVPKRPSQKWLDKMAAKLEEVQAKRAKQLAFSEATDLMTEELPQPAPEVSGPSEPAEEPVPVEEPEADAAQRAARIIAMVEKADRVGIPLGRVPDKPTDAWVSATETKLEAFLAKRRRQRKIEREKKKRDRDERVTRIQREAAELEVDIGRVPPFPTDDWLNRADMRIASVMLKRGDPPREVEIEAEEEPELVPSIIYEEGTLQEQRWVVEHDMVIGRAPSSDIQLIFDAGVSRRHCLLRVLDDGSFEIEDAGSTKGTLLDGERVHSNLPLVSGSVIQVGDTQLEFCMRPVES